MTLVLTVLCFCLLAAVTVLFAAAPKRSRLSPFELDRRSAAGEEEHILDARREAAYEMLVSLQRSLGSLLLVLLAFSLVGLLGWLVGGLLAAAAAVFTGALSRVTTVARVSERLYGRNEAAMLEFVERRRSLLRWITWPQEHSVETDISSKQELERLIRAIPDVLSEQEKDMITAGLKFDAIKVSDVMTPKSVVSMIKQGEVLGPLVLDDLHKTGHSRFPVIDEDIDHVVGILYVRDVLTLDTTKKRTSTAKSAMSNKVFYIRDDHTLAQALPAFLSSHHHLFIVINEFRETVGIITLEDTIEALIGRKIRDEFDAHEDLRAVALRGATGPHARNRTAASADV